MDSAERLKVLLFPGWVDCSAQNKDDLPTYMRETSEHPGLLQISCAVYQEGHKPNSSKFELAHIAAEFGMTHDLGNLTESYPGDCKFGRFGTAVFRSEDYPRFQIWFLSNGHDFIFVSHICPTEPDSQEVIEAHEIATRVILPHHKKSWWKVW